MLRRVRVYSFLDPRVRKRTERPPAIARSRREQFQVDDSAVWPTSRDFSRTKHSSSTADR